MLFLDVIQQTAGAGDDDFHAAMQGINLRTGANAAVNGNAAHVGFPPQAADGLVDLLRQLSGGGDDQRSGAFAAAR